MSETCSAHKKRNKIASDINYHNDARSNTNKIYNLDFSYISLFKVMSTVAAYFVQSCYARGFALCRSKQHTVSICTVHDS